MLYLYKTFKKMKKEIFDDIEFGNAFSGLEKALDENDVPIIENEDGEKPTDNEEEEIEEPLEQKETPPSTKKEILFKGL